MNKIIEILMERDGYSEEEATNQFNELKCRFFECLDDDPDIAYELLYEIDLEPDYILDFFE